MGPSACATVVFAAGLGTRLRPLTDIRPKALCPIDNRPLLDLAFEHAARFGGPVAVNVHAHRDQMEAHLAATAPDVHVSVEAKEPLGTAGALGALRDWIDGRPVVAINTDAWRPGDPSPILDGWSGDRPRLLVVDDPARADFGTKRFAGVSLLPRDEVRRLEPWPPTGLHEACWQPADEEGRLELVTWSGPFVDCGTPADYLAANMAASGGKSVVGPGAVIEGELVRSVVWPKGVVRRGERLVDAIRVGTDLTLRPGSDP